MKTLDPKIKEKLLSIKREDINKDFIEHTFCPHFDAASKKMIEPEISFQDEFVLKKGEYNNSSDVKTNVGQFIVNKVLYGNCPNIQKVLGYVAAPYTGDKVTELEDKIAKAMIDELVKPEEFANYLDNIQWLN